MPKLLLASSNPGKLREFRALLAGTGLELIAPAEIGLNLEVDETGQTYVENARLKAQAYALASGMIILADDSGLEVDALGGEPGIHSARYAPQPGADDAVRRRYLLSRLAAHPSPWPAHFHCTVAVAIPGGEVHFEHGDCHGEIIPQERGHNGFGYDPIFLVAGRQRTMAELPAHVKNEISHRARAVKASIPYLLEVVRKNGDKKTW